MFVARLFSIYWSVKDGSSVERWMLSSDTDLKGGSTDPILMFYGKNSTYTTS